MIASDAWQIVCKRKRKRRFLEQNFHQTLSEKMKKRVKRISNEKSTQSLRNVDEEHHVKKKKLHKNLIKFESFLAIHMKTRCIKLIDYFFSRRVFTVFTSNCFCEHSKQTLRHILLFCRNWSENRQRMLRDDETTNMSRFLNIAKNLKVSIIWLIKINLLIQFSLIKEYLD
jgi:hypothetical protein